MTISDHAYQRAKERLGWKKRTLERMAERVLVSGTYYKDMSKSMKEYIARLECKTGRTYIVYGEHLYSFDGDALITVFKVHA